MSSSSNWTGFRLLREHFSRSESSTIESVQTSENNSWWTRRSFVRRRSMIIFCQSSVHSSIIWSTNVLNIFTMTSCGFNFWLSSLDGCIGPSTINWLVFILSTIQSSEAQLEFSWKVMFDSQQSRLRSMRLIFKSRMIQTMEVLDESLERFNNIKMMFFSRHLCVDRHETNRLVLFLSLSQLHWRIHRDVSIRSVMKRAIVSRNAWQFSANVISNRSLKKEFLCISMSNDWQRHQWNDEFRVDDFRR